MKWFYRVLIAIVGVILVLELFNGAWYNAFLCFGTLLLFAIPSLIERQVHINIPDPLEVIVLLFIFAAEILGELRGYYFAFPYWDTMLHTINGFLCAAIGLALIDIFDKSPRFAISLSPIFVVLVAFCFSMTVGVMWEFFEYFADLFFHTNMQKDTIFADGYIDIGLIDTMEDLLVNFLGAVIFCVFGYFYVKHDGRSKLLPHILLTRSANVKGKTPATTAAPATANAPATTAALDVTAKDGSTADFDVSTPDFRLDSVVKSAETDVLSVTGQTADVRGTADSGIVPTLVDVAAERTVSETGTAVGNVAAAAAESAVSEADAAERS